MMLNDTGNSTNSMEKPMDGKQLKIIVNGSSVKLNFPPDSEGAVISDIKRMMLGCVSKP